MRFAHQIFEWNEDHVTIIFYLLGQSEYDFGVGKDIMY